MKGADNEEPPSFVRASEVADVNAQAKDKNQCISGYKRCPGPDGDRPSCDDCWIIARLDDPETVAGADG